LQLAPPPRKVWAEPEEEPNWFEDADEEVDEELAELEMMYCYRNCDAVVVTVPVRGEREYNIDDRLEGIRWFATQGNDLPPAVERIVVIDATDLALLPMGAEEWVSVDMESFWSGVGRTPTRVILRRGKNLLAVRSAEESANLAAEAAAMALAARNSAETGESEAYAEKALEIQLQAQELLKTVNIEAESVRIARLNLENLYVASERLKTFEHPVGGHNKLNEERSDEYYASSLRSSYTPLTHRVLTLFFNINNRGVKVEVLSTGGNLPIDIMTHLGKFSSHEVVVWRAACWGQRGVDAVLSGAFTYITAHMQVAADGGIFWQTILAENALQAALGQRNKIVCESAKDVELQFCGEWMDDCPLDTKHVVLEADVTVVDRSDKKSRKVAKFKKLGEAQVFGGVKEEAPWMF